MAKLSNPRREGFAQEYLKDNNGAQAAIRAGYAEGSAKVTASRLLSDDNVRARIDELKEEQQKRVKIDADFVLNGIRAIANVDPADFYDEDGRLKNIHDIPIEARRAMAGIDSFEEYTGHGKERELSGYTKRIKRTDSLKAWELLAKHLRLLGDNKFEVPEGGITLNIISEIPGPPGSITKDGKIPAGAVPEAGGNGHGQS